MVRRRFSKVILLALATTTVLIFVLYGNSRLSEFYMKPGVDEFLQVLQMDDGIQEVPTTTEGSAPSYSLEDLWQNKEYARRRQQCENTCVQLRDGAVMRTTRHSNTSYCVVPKVGCTFWLNVFRFLHNDTGDKTYASPFHIPRMATHYAPMKRMKMYAINSTFTPPNLASDLRFMFVREPYSRLWSAYVDKFLLVDYWRSEGQQIIKKRQVKGNATTRPSKCAHDVSFREFVEYVVSVHPAALNEHWKPIQQLCSPCLYRPHVVGKMETFAQDARYLLEHMNLSWVLDSYQYEKHVVDEIDMLIDYNFQLLRHHFYKNCTNATDIAKRLWTTFQINGYLTVENDFPHMRIPENLNATRFKELVHEFLNYDSPKTRSEAKQQREQAMIEAYRQLPTETLKKLRKLYGSDFELFGYDPTPYILFRDRQTDDITS